MELTKSKFKQTEIGWIPEDWEVVEFEKLGSFYKGKGIKKDEVKSQGIPCIRYGELYTVYNDIIKESVSFIHTEVAKNSFRLNYGDLLFAGSGETKEDIGKSAVILRDDTYAGGDIVIFRAQDIDHIFLGYVSNSNPVNRQKAINGQGDAVVHIYSSGISKIKIPLPPLPEQRAIAEVLTDTDALLQSLRDQVAKKRAIKQGAMQRLLRPVEGWEVRKLGEVADITKLAGFEYSNYFNSYKDGGEIIVLRGTNITNNKLDLSDVKRIPEKTSKFLIRSKLNKGDLVFAYVGTIGPVFLVESDNKFHLGPNTSKITVKSNLDANYLFYYFTSSLIQKEINEHTSIGAQPSLSMTKIRKFKILLPKIKQEQTRIATILSDMDSELAELEQKVEKYEQMKQGLMQVLLTGKVRLV